MDQSNTDNSINQPPAKRYPRWRALFWRLLLLGLVVIMTAGLIYAYWQNNQLRSSLAAKDSQIAGLTSDNARLQAATNKQATPESAPKLTIQEEVQLAAGQYVCIMTSLICDKTAITVEELMEGRMGDPASFVIVTATDAAGDSTQLHLKQADSGSDWLVYYQGSDTPSRDVIELYGVPEGFYPAD